MPELKTPRLLNAKTILAESDIHKRGPNEEPGIDLVWRPSDDDPPLPHTRLRRYRTAGSASIYFHFEGTEWHFEVCGFIEHSSEKSGRSPTFEEALETAATELSNRINQVWRSEFPQQLETQQIRDVTEESLKAAHELQRDIRHNIENKESNDDGSEG